MFHEYEYSLFYDNTGFVKEALKKMESLSILYLNNNGIEKIHEDSFMGFGQNLTDIWLQNNGYVSNAAF